jgi:hypothetical protein
MITFGEGEAAEEAIEVTDLAVIGSQEDCERFIGEPGYNVLNDPNWGSDPLNPMRENDAWVQSVISQKQPVFLATEPNLMGDALLDYTAPPDQFGTVFAREIDQLMEAGYQVVQGYSGKFLFPP